MSREAKGRIWLIGGTSESVQLAKAIAECDFPCTISVTSEAARGLYPPSPRLRVWVGLLDEIEVGEFLHEQQIVAILDASHPYAVNISHLAILAATQWQLPYLRYERLPLKPSERTGNKGDSVIELPNWEMLLAGQYLAGERVLLTVGYRPLPLFRSWHKDAVLFARILPSLLALRVALEAGFTGERLIAMRQPISADLETALWHQWQISMVVTKASGTVAGEDVKRKVAGELGVKLIVIERPILDYPQQTSDLARAIEFCGGYV